MLLEENDLLIRQQREYQQELVIQNQRADALTSRVIQLEADKESRERRVKDQEALIDELERRALRSETEVGRLNGMLVEQSKTIEENKVMIGGRESDGARRLNMEEMVSSYQVRVQFA